MLNMTGTFGQQRSQSYLLLVMQCTGKVVNFVEVVTAVKPKSSGMQILSLSEISQYLPHHMGKRLLLHK